MARASPPGVRGARNLLEEQARNRRTTWLLIGGFVLFLAFLGFGFDLFVLGYDATLVAGRGAAPIPIAALFATVCGGASAWFGFRYGDRAVLASSFARPIRPDDPGARVLMNVVTEMAIASGLPMPKVYVVDDPDPNAFATGRDPDHASIAVTTGLLTTMNREELQAVIAHEMSHIRNYDIRKMTVVAALLGALLLLSDWASRVRLRGGRSRDDEDRGGLSGPLALLVFVVWIVAIILAPIIGQLLATAVSRSREYLADASGAELTRNPLGLAKALRKLEAATSPTARIARGTAHLCITDPLNRAIDEHVGRLADLLATHPPIHDRIARLEEMAYQVPTAG
ncbi:MAG: M48 family metalloprotease [Candidatus Rokuibacteriota bacterium]